MELIHTYRGARELKHIRFGFDDEKEFINRFNLSIITAKKLCRIQNLIPNSAPFTMLAQ